jgi:hypothetical protein
MTLLIKALPLRAPVKALAWFLLVVAGGLVWADNPMFSGVEAEMSASEQAASGVDQLSPEQLKALNSWLFNRFGGQRSANAQPPTPTTATASLTGDADLEATIDAEVARRVAQEVAAVKQEMQQADTSVEQNEPFEATIQGSFKGWGSKTVFPLDNGQVWRQRNSSQYRHTSGDNRVRFERNFLGLWQMTVLSSGRTVGVRRVD